MLDVKTIITATDFSDLSDHTVRYAASFAGQIGAKLVIVHAIDVQGMALAADPFLGGHAMFNLDFTALRDSVEDHLHELREDLTGEIETVVLEGNPAQAIIEVANERDADLIILGTAGRGALARAVVGSVADRVVRTAKVPVLTVNKKADHDIAEDLTQTTTREARPEGGL